MISLGRFLGKGEIFLMRPLPGAVMTTVNCHAADECDFNDVRGLFWSNWTPSWFDLVPGSFYHDLFVSLKRMVLVSS